MLKTLIADSTKVPQKCRGKPGSITGQIAVKKAGPLGDLVLLGKSPLPTAKR